MTLLNELKFALRSLLRAKGLAREDVAKVMGGTTDSVAWLPPNHTVSGGGSSSNTSTDV